MMKTCSKCGETKPLDAFHKRPDRPIGVRPKCRACEALAQKAYAAKNLPKLAAARRRYDKDNPEKKKRSRAVDYEQNRDSYIRRAKIWAQQNTANRQAICAKNQALQIKELSDLYVRRLLCRRGSIDAVPQALIELKREQLRLWRLIREFEQATTPTESEPQT